MFFLRPCCAYVQPTPVDVGLQLLEQAVVPVRCPGCKVQGDLEDGCMKIPCPTPGCEKIYCYICGDDLGRDDPYSHFRQSRTCALFISDYHERDPSWPPDVQDALEMFHALAIRRNLKEAQTSNPEAFELAVRSNGGQRILQGLDLYINFPNNKVVMHSISVFAFS